MHINHIETVGKNIISLMRKYTINVTGFVTVKIVIYIANDFCICSTIEKY